MKLTLIKSASPPSYFLGHFGNPSHNSPSLLSLLIDGEKPSPTFHEGWVEIKKKPKKIQSYESQLNTNYRYVIKDKKFLNLDIKEVYSREEVAYKKDYSWYWKEEYSHLSSLYKLVYDENPDILVDLPFDILVTMKVEEVKQSEFSYNIIKQCGFIKNKKVLAGSDVQQQLMDEIIFPTIMYPSLPCKLSSKQMFDIIRAYIKDNIDPKVAKILSDYDFHFSVEKRIPLHTPEEYSVDVNAFSLRKRKPKYEKRMRKERNHKLLDISHNKTGNKYGGSVVSAIIGENHEDLKGKIDKYLKDLITHINEPVKDCPHCEGDGVILDKRKEKENEQNN